MADSVEILFIVMRRARLMVAAGFLTLALVAGSGIGTTRVSAEPVGPGLDSWTTQCRSLQNQAQALIAEYGQIGRANPSDPRLEDILNQLRQIGMNWQQIGCQAGFGSIALVPAPLPPPYLRGIALPSGATTARANG